MWSFIYQHAPNTESLCWLIKVIYICLGGEGVYLITCCVMSTYFCDLCVWYIYLYKKVHFCHSLHHNRSNALYILHRLMHVHFCMLFMHVGYKYSGILVTSNLVLVLRKVSLKFNAIHCVWDIYLERKYYEHWHALNTLNYIDETWLRINPCNSVSDYFDYIHQYCS